MRTYFFVDGKETNIQEYFFTKGKKGYVEKITHDNDSNEIRTLIFNEAEYKLNELRKKRSMIFRNGFEPYKSNVQYGIEIETEEQHREILEWYNEMLDIEKTEIAIENIPEIIRYYLGGLKK